MVEVMMMWNANGEIGSVNERYDVVQCLSY